MELSLAHAEIAGPPGVSQARFVPPALAGAARLPGPVRRAGRARSRSFRWRRHCIDARQEERMRHHDRESQQAPPPPPAGATAAPAPIAAGGEARPQEPGGPPGDVSSTLRRGEQWIEHELERPGVGAIAIGAALVVAATVA